PTFPWPIQPGRMSEILWSAALRASRTEKEIKSCGKTRRSFIRFRNYAAASSLHRCRGGFQTRPYNFAAMTLDHGADFFLFLLLQQRIVGFPDLSKVAALLFDVTEIDLLSPNFTNFFSDGNIIARRHMGGITCHRRQAFHRQQVIVEQNRSD